MDFLKYLDVLIGLAVVMVLLSPMVTAVTQLWMWLRSRRSQFLLQALHRLIHQIDGRLEAERSLAIARAVVRHPLIARAPITGSLSKFPPFRNREGEVIEREELIRVLLELATDEGPATKGFDETTKADLHKLLERNGITHAKPILDRIREEAQELEKTNPELAAHVRNTQAIVTAAKSPLVGKILQWFDAAMARATQQYAAEARVVTVAAALVVAVVIQLDSLDLLRRLSVDDNLRSALLTEAQHQQDRAEKLAADAKAAGAKADAATQDNLELARRRTEEVQQNLATLRSPNLSVVPPLFIWQSVPRARLDTNPLWPKRYPPNYELMVGGVSYPLRPQWRRAFLPDLKYAIDNSKAPVTAAIELDSAVLLRAEEPLGLRVVTAGKDVAEPLESVARARLSFSPTWPDSFDYSQRPMWLWVDDASYLLPLKAHRDGVPAALSSLIDRIAADNVSVACKDGTERLIDCATSGAPVLLITARDPKVQDIRLHWKDEPWANVLNDVERAPRVWRLPGRALRRIRGPFLTLSAPEILPRPLTAPTDFIPDPSYVAGWINGATKPNARTGRRPLAASTYRADALVLTAQQKGPLELRYQPGSADANMLNAAGPAWPILRATQQTLLGILLSWVLLSLGAPFWFDALKNFLKLRPAAAVVEEQNRIDRNTQNDPPKRK